ncbi:hypothetical protein ACIRN5_23350, partial [Lysinibacillus fusiformis]|uniref:hypothetical protein n=2 Tax=Bacillati TaxID=1783272 RepID=UPI003826A718
SYNAYQARTQVTAMAAMLAALLGALAALRFGHADQAGQLAVLGYGAVLGAGALWLEVRPLAALLATFRLTAALLVALATAPRTWRGRRAAGW